MLLGSRHDARLYLAGLAVPGVCASAAGAVFPIAVAAANFALGFMVTLLGIAGGWVGVTLLAVVQARASGHEGRLRFTQLVRHRHRDPELGRQLIRPSTAPRALALLGHTTPAWVAAGYALWALLFVLPPSLLLIGFLLIEPGGT